MMRRVIFNTTSSSSHVSNWLAKIQALPVLTTEFFIYLRFIIDDRSVEEKDFGRAK